MGLFPLNYPLKSLIMGRGPQKHMKRLAAPKSWMLDKLGGVYSCRPSSGPHKLGESMPIPIFLRNRLKYALTAKEVSTIMKQRLIKVDGKVRTDARFPAGFMDVKGRYTIHRITNQEAKYKLCRVREIKTGPKNVPYLYTSDGRTIRYPDPIVKMNDSIRLDINTGKIMDSIKFEAGNLCMVTGGRNTGRVGTIMHRESHPGSFDIVHVKDAAGHTFATRMGYIFVIGKGNKPYISLPKGQGIKLSTAEERDKRLQTRT